MKFGADVVSLTVSKADDDRVNYPAFEAADESSAARMVAEWEAARKYEEDGSVGHITAVQMREGVYLAEVGEQKRSETGIALHGVTIEIRLFPVEGLR